MASTFGPSAVALAGNSVDRWELALALVVGAGLAGGCYWYSVWSDRTTGHRGVCRVALRELQSERQRSDDRWVSLCGTVFDVSGDQFFDVRAHGVYGTWAGHDVTYLLLEMGVNMGLADDDASMARLLDVDMPFDLLQSDKDSKAAGKKEKLKSRRRREILQEWLGRFHSRYAVIAQLSDVCAGKQWDRLRKELVPRDGQKGGGKCPMGFGSSSDDSSGRREGGKCPMGFGSRGVTHKVSRSDPAHRRTIAFQGKTFDVTESSLFQDGGELAHFVGHDVTYALAMHSNRSEDLDRTAPPRGYSYEEQIVLERYRRAFGRDFPIVEDGSDALSKSGTATQLQSAPVDLHMLIENIESSSNAAGLEEILQIIRETATDIDAICVRTSMTPLHKAVEKNQLALVKALVEAGADVQAQAALYDDETPLEMARRFHYDDIATYLAVDRAGT